MIAGFLRLFVAVLVLAGVAILFVYAFVAALIITPILFGLLYLFGRKSNVNWWVVRRETGYEQRPGQVIEHDPNDLPPP